MVRVAGVVVVDVVHQFVGDQRIVVYMRPQVAAHVVAGGIVAHLAGYQAALRWPVAHQVQVAAGADVAGTEHQLVDPVGVVRGEHHRRLPALRVAD